MNHPLFAAKIDVSETCLSLIDQLIENMGIDAYCVWLANETPAEWTTTTPLEQIALCLQNKVAEQETTP